MYSLGTQWICLGWSIRSSFQVYISGARTTGPQRINVMYNPLFHWCHMNTSLWFRLFETLRITLDEVQSTVHSGPTRLLVGTSDILEIWGWNSEWNSECRQSCDAVWQQCRSKLVQRTMWHLYRRNEMQEMNTATEFLAGLPLYFQYHDYYCCCTCYATIPPILPLALLLLYYYTLYC